MVSEDGKNGKTRVKPRTTGRSGSFGFWRLVGRPRVGPPISLCVLQRPATREEVALCLTKYKRRKGGEDFSDVFWNQTDQSDCDPMHCKV